MKRLIAALGGALLLASSAYAQTPDRGSCPDCAMMHRGMMTREMNVGVKPILNSANGGIVTMMGFEALGISPGGWQAGLGMYGGINLGIQNYTSGLKYGGIILGHDLSLGGLGLNAGVLLGYGVTGDLTPTLGFNNIYGFGALEPRIGVKIPMGTRASLGLDAAYLLSNNPKAAFGPSVYLNFTVRH